MNKTSKGGVVIKNHVFHYPIHHLNSGLISQWFPRLFISLSNAKQSRLKPECTKLDNFDFKLIYSNLK